MSDDSSDEVEVVDPTYAEVLNKIRTSNISINFKSTIFGYIDKLVKDNLESQTIRQQLTSLRASQQSQPGPLSSGQIRETSSQTGPELLTTQTIPLPFTSSTPVFTQRPITRSVSASNLLQSQVSPIVPNQTHTVSVGQTTMAQLSAQDLADITAIVQSNKPLHETRLRTFNGNTSDAVSWYEDWDCFSSANNLDADKLRNTLGTYLTGPAKEWWFLEIKGTNKDAQGIKDSFYKQFLPIDYNLHMRNEFRSRKQKLFETSANFICSMRRVLERSGQNISEADAVAFILRNMQPDIAEKLIVLNPQTYDELRTFSNRVEQSLKAGVAENSDGALLTLRNQMRNLNINNEIGQNFNQPRPSLNYNRNFSSRTINGRPRCYKCNKVGHTQFSCQSGQQRQQYQTRNHFNGRNRNQNRNRFQSYSRPNRGGFRNNGNRSNWNNRNGNNYNRNVQLMNNDNSNENVEQNVEILGVLGSTDNGFIINVTINGHEVKAILDSGASVCFLSQRYASENNLLLSKWTGQGYRQANGDTVKPVGQTKIKLSITLNGITKTAELSIYVIKGLTAEVIIGYNVIRKLGIVINGKDNTISF